jgi:type II secretory pathway pseudopilin PulG
MLAVVAIMGVVMAIAVVAFTGIGRGAAAKTAANQMHASLRLARQYALTRKSSVAFLVCAPEQPAVFGRPDLDPEKFFGKAYAIYDVRKCRYLQAWTELPKNITFDERSVTTVFRKTRGENVLELPTLDLDIPFPSDWNTNALQRCRFPGIRFNSDGRLHVRATENWYRWILVCEGTYDTRTRRWVRKGANVSQVVPNTLTYGAEVAYAGNVRLEHLRAQ